MHIAFEHLPYASSYSTSLLWPSRTMKIKWPVNQQVGHKHTGLHTSTHTYAYTHTHITCVWFSSRRDCYNGSEWARCCSWDECWKTELTYVSFYLTERGGDVANLDFISGPLWLRPLVCGKAARLLGRDRKEEEKLEVILRYDQRVERGGTHWPRHPPSSLHAPASSFTTCLSCSFLIIGLSMWVMTVLACMQDVCVRSVCLLLIRCLWMM